MTKVNIMKLLLICIIKCICFNTSSSDKEFVLDSLSKYCPYLRTCSQPARQEFTYARTKFMPCCQECSCSPLCHVEGNCCPDVSHNSTDIPGHLSQEADTLSREKCIQSVYPGYANANGFYSNTMYSAVVTCPEDHPSNAIANKCTAEVPDTIEQVTLVSDDKGTIYRNIYCAQCNDVQRIKRWRTMVSCAILENPEVSFQIELSHILDRKCKLISIPQGSLQRVENKRCFVPDISECNTTGRWDVYDEDIETGCLTVNSVYLSKFMSNVFKNIYCYICDRSRPFLDDVCPVPTYATKGLGHPFSAILDFSVLSSDVDRSSKHCRRHEIYDPFFMLCRELICPPDSSPVNGECVRAFVKTDGFAMIFYLIVKPAENLKTVPTEREGETILNSVYNYVTSRLNQNCLFCSFVGKQVLMFSANYTLVIELKTMTTFKCPLSVLLKSVEDLNFLISNDDSTANFSAELIEKAYMDRHSYILEASKTLYYEHAAMCIHGIIFSRFVSCPRVVISGLDFQIALINNTMRNISRYDQYDIDKLGEHRLANMTFELCVADYIYAENTACSHTAWFNRYHVGISVLCLWHLFGV